MREPGASEVLMCGCTLKPASTAFLASRPAASSTPGLEVLVHDVIAAISTSPLPMVTPEVAEAVAVKGVAAECAASMVGLLPSISASWRGAPAGVGGVSGGASQPNK